MEQADTVSRQGWSERVFAAAPLPPSLLGAGLAVASVLLLVGLAWAVGDLATLTEQGGPWWQNRDARLAVLVSVLAVGVVTAIRYHAVGTRRDLEAVARLGGWSVAEVDPSRTRGDARRTWLAGALGALLVPLVALLVDRDPSVYLMDGYWFFSKAWTWLLGCAATAGGGVLTYRAARDARRFSRLAGRLEQIDLLEPSKLAPFARQALRATLPGLLGLSFIALNALDQGFAWAIGVVGTLSLASGIPILGVPLRRVRDRVRRAKREELSRVHGAIRGEPGALSGSPIEPHAPLALADLLAWRDEIEAVPEWPLDPGTLGRYGLYLAIPVASWVGGAMVERLLDLFLS